MNEANADLFAKSEYRRTIAWSERLRREAPFLKSVFDAAPSRTLLDVGCGTGEHSRHFAEMGWRVVGIDAAESMIAQARDHAGATSAGGSARFELRRAEDAASLSEAPFGGAIVLGNTLAFLETEDALHRFFAGVGGALAKNAVLLLQMLNYERIEALPVRALPVNVSDLPAEEGEGDLVFIRVFRPRADGTLGFYPVTLGIHPGRTPLVEIRNAREGVHYPWKRPRVEAALAANGFSRLRALGGMGEMEYNPLLAHDLVILARKD